MTVASKSCSRTSHDSRSNPSISPKMLQGWATSLMKSLNDQSQKYQYAALYRQLLTEVGICDCITLKYHSSSSFRFVMRSKSSQLLPQIASSARRGSSDERPKRNFNNYALYINIWSMWGISEGDCFLRGKTMHHQLLLGLQRSTRVLFCGQFPLFQLAWGSRRKRESPVRGTCFAILSFTWAYRTFYQRFRWKCNATVAKTSLLFYPNFPSETIS
ncbi:hypothetical protein BJ875DRAFT_450989 [Amylocarpus encephaloides]|uniref:Uncharacterized protein n=1 Tax=Amylocarpus encephaloides TaxID=45428 RepID=A0A9P8C976_9HELO|nr:hypothetical protein BJ875DRAFT_450989 [Amylocarpus encephaloides]